MLERIDVAGVQILVDPNEIFGKSGYFDTRIEIHIRNGRAIIEVNDREKGTSPHADADLVTSLDFRNDDGENQVVANSAGLKEFASEIAPYVKTVLGGISEGGLTEEAAEAWEEVINRLETVDSEQLVRCVVLWDAGQLADNFVDDVTAETSDQELRELAEITTTGANDADNFYYGTVEDVESELRTMRDELAEDNVG